MYANTNTHRLTGCRSTVPRQASKFSRQAHGEAGFSALHADIASVQVPYSTLPHCGSDEGLGEPEGAAVKVGDGEA